jgi:undecaprenyl-diphosphatase
MEVLRAIILGAIQGITEFLPISSSGHLVILGEVLGRGFGGETTTTESVLLHLGSLIAIMIVFRQDLARLVYPRIEWRLFGMLFIASLPVAVGGFVVKRGLPADQIQWVEVFVLQSPWVAAFALFATSALLWVSERPRPVRVTMEGARGRDYWLVLVIGFAQMVSLLPGISRSGATICTALLLHWVRSDAIRLSFLMGLIAIFGAGLIEARDMTAIDPAPAIAGFVSSLIFSLFGLWLIKLIVYRQKLRWFAVYCFVAGAATIAYFVAYPPVLE